VAELTKPLSNPPHSLSDEGGSKAVLQAEHLNHSFGPSEILRDINFTLNQGDVISVFQSLVLVVEVKQLCFICVQVFWM